MPPALELDPHHFEIVAQSPAAALVRHKPTGHLYVERLAWRSDGPYIKGFEAKAWQDYIEAINANSGLQPISKTK